MRFCRENIPVGQPRQLILRSLRIANKLLSISSEVKSALREGKPIVALESSVIAQGLPRPQNIEVARALEDVARACGAVPATIGILDGVVKVGLQPRDIDRLARDADVRKAGVRDLGIAAVQGWTAGTTVSSTMRVATLAGIRIMATGGIGGVHRGGEVTLDVSADLVELSRTTVGVVCSGAKALLDLPATLEFLETHGVPVLGYGTSEFPAFYSRESGLGVDAAVGSPREAAEVLRASWEAGLKGVLIAVPVPSGQEIKKEVLEAVIVEALAAARAGGIRGGAVTPFVLGKIHQATSSRSYEANVALLKNNVRVAAEVAQHLAPLRPAPRPDR